MDGIATPGVFLGFLALLAVLLAADLALLRRATLLSLKQALWWSAAWIAISLLFNGWLALRYGPTAGLEFLTGYLVEKSLSIENIFVFALIFGALKIPIAAQQRVLPLGIIGAIVLRGAVIAAGTALLDRFEWLLYPFGAFLVYTGAKLFLNRHARDAEAPLLGLARRIVPSAEELDGGRWTTVRNGRRLATPLLLALILVTVADAVFAVDSVPAVLAVTRDPFIVFSSNALAILGLRALYFAVAALLQRFRYLKAGLAGILLFVGAKMMLADAIHVPPFLSLAVIVAILGAAVVLSLRSPSAPQTGRAPG